jgi:Subtilase family
MKAAITNNKILRRSCQLSGVLIGALVIWKLGHTVGTDGPLAPLSPRSSPYALEAGSKTVPVRFSVRLAGDQKDRKDPIQVFLRRTDNGQLYEMNDAGKEGDLIVGDRVYGVNVAIDTLALKPESCLQFDAFTRVGRLDTASLPHPLCVSALPVRMAQSNEKNPIKLPDGSEAVADEILLNVVPGTREAVIVEVAASVEAKVVGGIPHLYSYQLRLPGSVSAGVMLELIAKLNARKDVVTIASVNPLGSLAFTPSDPEFALQHGLARVRADDAWDVGALANGSGVTVVVLDSGINRTHLDFGTSPGNCQLAADDCGGANNDAVGHGTQVAGVIGAKTNNGLGIAGSAFGSKIHSIQMTADSVVTATEMQQGFTDAAAYGVAKVINASFSQPVGAGTAAQWNAVCLSINNAVLNAGVPVAVVVNAVGNNGANANYYPARCNDLNVNPVNKELLITVGSSASVVSPVCGNVGIGQRCAADLNPASTQDGSNYGPWVDIAAPGSLIRTTLSTGGYDYATGTSVSAPLVSSAVAILSSCGVPLNDIESTLRTSADWPVPYPAIGSMTNTPELNIYLALQQRNLSPTGLGLSSNTVSENTNTAGGFEVGTLTAVDPNICDKFTYSIVGGADQALFSIGGVGNDRLVLTAGVLDYEVKSSYAVTIRVTDFFGVTVDQPITVNVIDLNDNSPVISSNGGGAAAAVSVPENTTAVTTVTATDADAGSVLTYSLSGADAARFTINLAGALTFNPAPDFESPTDAGGNNVYDVTVQVSDGLNTDTQAIAVTVTNVNDNFPVISSNGGGAAAATSVPENTTAVTTVLASDGDAGSTLTYSISGGADQAMFSINGGTGALTFAVAPNFEVPTDVGANNVYDVTVQVSDGLNVDTQAIAVTVTNAGEAPVITSDGGGATAALMLEESTLVNNLATVTTVTATDPDAGSTLTFSISGGADAALFSITPAGVLTRVLIPANVNFNFEFPNDAGANGVYDVIVQVSDGTNTDTQAIALTIQNDNNADNGDPHIQAVGINYDFQSAGEFVALRGGPGMEIQTRQSPISAAAPLPNSYTGLTVGVSVNTAVAARVGKNRVTYQPNISGGPASSGLELRIDGMLTTLPAGGIKLSSGGKVTPLSNGIQIDFPDGTKMTAIPGWWSTYNVWYMNINVTRSTARDGLMGARPNPKSWLPRLGDGTAVGARPVDLAARYKELYVTFANSWRVNEKTSLFDYAKGTSTATFTNLAWPLEAPPFVIEGQPVAKPLDQKTAQLACVDVVDKARNAECVFDVMVTGNMDFAKLYLQGEKQRTATK